MMHHPQHPNVQILRALSSLSTADELKLIEAIAGGHIKRAVAEMDAKRTHRASESGGGDDPDIVLKTKCADCGDPSKWTSEIDHWLYCGPLGFCPSAGY